MKLSYLDPLTRWVPNWRPENEDPDILPYLDRSPDAFFRVAEALQVDKIHLIGTFPAGGARGRRDNLMGRMFAPRT